MLLPRLGKEQHVIAEKHETGGGEPDVVKQWTKAFGELHARAALR